MISPRKDEGHNPRVSHLRLDVEDILVVRHLPRSREWETVDPGGKGRETVYALECPTRSGKKL